MNKTTFIRCSKCGDILFIDKDTITVEECRCRSIKFKYPFLFVAPTIKYDLYHCNLWLPNSLYTLYVPMFVMTKLLKRWSIASRIKR